MKSLFPPLRSPSHPMTKKLKKELILILENSANRLAKNHNGFCCTAIENSLFHLEFEKSREIETLLKKMIFSVFDEQYSLLPQSRKDSYVLSGDTVLWREYSPNQNERIIALYLLIEMIKSSEDFQSLF